MDYDVRDSSLTVRNSLSMLGMALLEAEMARLRAVMSVLLSLCLWTLPVWGAPTSAMGTVVYSSEANVGTAGASVGSSVFGGDRLSTSQAGSIQVRAGAARFLLAKASSATLLQDETTPGAVLTAGSATFSTASSRAFEVHVANAVIRPETSSPTIGQVTVLNPNELVVKSTRGSLTITVDNDSRIIPEGGAYHIVLNPSDSPTAGPQNPAGVGTRNGGSPVKAGRSRFMWYAVALTTVVTVLAVHAALESPDRP
jgi:hypothetical protein